MATRSMRSRGLLVGLALVLSAGAFAWLSDARADETPAHVSAEPDSTMPVSAEPDPTTPVSAEPDPMTPVGDPANGENWRYCAVDGFLSSCCGGTQTACPPGTEMSTVTWLGTCRNPADGKDYVISYNDCCGKPACGRCFVNRNEGDKPVYVTPKANDINWCMGSATPVYNSTVAIVVGVASEAGAP